MRDDAKAELQLLRKESAERRAVHPDWPSHKITLTSPSGQHCVSSETMPLGRHLKSYRGYCKYCYRRHGKWWVMDSRDYVEGETMLLCEFCEYTSLREA